MRFLSRADIVVVLEDGRVKECGPPEEILPHLLQQNSSEEESGSPKQEGNIKEAKIRRTSEKVKESLLMPKHLRVVVVSHLVTVTSNFDFAP